MMNSYENMNAVNLKVCNSIIHEKKSLEWVNETKLVPKLRTYCIFKHEYKTESYVQSIHNRQERSILSQFRMGVLPLSIETGRFQNIPIEYRLCVLCDDNVCESESHFLFYCKFYQELRSQLLLRVQVEYPLFIYLEDEHKLTILMSDTFIRETGKYLCNAFQKRRNTLYK